MMFLACAAAAPQTLASQAQAVSEGASAPMAAPGQSAPAVRSMEVWARGVFGPDGRLIEIDLADEAGYPAAFAQQVRRQLEAARIQPPLRDGQPSRFETGIRLRYSVTTQEDGAKVRLLGLAIRPLPLERSVPPLPLEILRSRAWRGSVKGTCTVDEQGRCAQVEIEALPGMPESLRRWARVAMSQWRFEPQRLADQPVAGEFDHQFHVGVGDSRPEDFRVSKFDRIERQRR